MSKNKLSISSEKFGELDSSVVHLFRLSNGVIDVLISDYGCTIISIEVPDRYGKQKNVVAGFSSLAGYLQPHPYLGCVVGRFANRIAFGKLNIAGVDYNLTVNDDPNHLHGGIHGFHTKVWQVDGIIEEHNKVGVRLSYVSPDGEEGYPGCLKTFVTYSLDEDNELVIHYTANTDKPTVVNLTNHSYFNLTGFESPDIYEHVLQIFAQNYTEKNKFNVPSGKISSVSNTPFDFREPKMIGEGIGEIKVDGGYDQNFVLDGPGDKLRLAAELYEGKSGRVLKVFTDRPGIQLYTANFWDGSLKDGMGNRLEKHAAVAIETQDFPDAPNHKNFPDTILNPGETYNSNTIFQFLTR